MTGEATDGVQALKAARNQTLWREVNERIRARVTAPGDMEFLCECADLDCKKTLRLTLPEYDRIRSSPARFPTAFGHDVPQVEDVVEEKEHFVVVEKRGVAGEIAARLDPRAQEE
jgi:hypothetical protein